MHPKKGHQGEMLEYLVKKSGLKKGEASSRLNIHPSHLARVFASESISPKIRKEAAIVFGVNESVFDEGLGYQLPESEQDRVGENGEEYRALVAEVERLKSENARMAAEILREREVSDDLRKALLLVAAGKRAEE